MPRLCSQNKIIQKLFSSNDGYSLDIKLSEAELNQLRDLISEQWLTVIDQFSPKMSSLFREKRIEKYHEVSDLLPHADLWKKSVRILPEKAVQKIRTFKFIAVLTALFGDFIIANEENMRNEEIYWRLVRPKMISDVGPMHADAWFWELGHGATPKNKLRIKIWIPLCCEPGLNGLTIVPGSHVREWKYSAENRDGLMKPQFDESQIDLPIILPETNAGEAIIFNDKLLHKGAINNGHYTRVSVEFTMFVDKAILV